MAVECGAAADLRAGLELTPNQIVEFGEAVAHMRDGEGTPQRRRGGPEEFKAMILGAVGG